MSEETKKPTFIDRVVASSTTIAPSKALFTLLALPFYLLGLVLGVLYVVFVTFAWGALTVGVADVRQRATSKRAS